MAKVDGWRKKNPPSPNPILILNPQLTAPPTPYTIPPSISRSKKAPRGSGDPLSGLDLAIQTEKNKIY
jgi:hypothetical protein